MAITTRISHFGGCTKQQKCPMLRHRAPLSPPASMLVTSHSGASCRASGNGVNGALEKLTTPPLLQYRDAASARRIASNPRQRPCVNGGVSLPRRRRAVAIRAGSGSQSRVWVRMLALCAGRLPFGMHATSIAGIPWGSPSSPTSATTPHHCTSSCTAPRHPPAAAGLGGLPNHY